MPLVADLSWGPLDPRPCPVAGARVVNQADSRVRTRCSGTGALFQSWSSFPVPHRAWGASPVAAVLCVDAAATHIKLQETVGRISCRQKRRERVTTASRLETKCLLWWPRVQPLPAGSRLQEAVGQLGLKRNSHKAALGDSVLNETLTGQHLCI